MERKIRIAFVIPGLGKGGAERLLIDICRQLKDNPLVDYYLVVLSLVNDYQALTDDLKIKHINIKLATFNLQSRKNDLLEWFDFLDSFQPDIIHSHIYYADLVSRSRIQPGVKYFSHLHGRTTQFETPPFVWMFSKPCLFLKKGIEKFYVKKLYKKSKTMFLCVSEFYKNYIEKNLNYKNNLAFYNGIDYSRFYSGRRYNPSGGIRLISVGRLVDNKNHIFLIKVAEALKKRGLGFKLTILGDGPFKDHLFSFIKELDLANEVFLHGNVNNPEDFYKISDIYLHSALDEAFGLTILEAMAAGLPVITLDGKGNRDLIVQGKNGYMLMEKDAEKFAGKIVELWENKSLYREMATYAQEFAKGYDIKEYMCRLLEIYRKAI